MATRATSVEGGRLDEARAGRAVEALGAVPLASGSGAPSARTTATTATPGTTSRHDQARSRAYRWGEDGLAGISDDQQLLCFALALWNGRDPILKERLFGLTNSEGNHGEDVKEYYFYLDSHADALVHEVPLQVPAGGVPVRRPGRDQPRAAARDELEYELLDTGVFDDDRYFDVFVEYAKASPEDILIRITRHNRGPEAATLHLLPTLWFRNTWSWRRRRAAARAREPAGATRVAWSRRRIRELGERLPLLRRRAPSCCSPRTRPTRERLFGAAEPRRRTSRTASTTTSSTAAATRSTRRSTGTKAAAHYALDGRGRAAARSLRLRLTRRRRRDGAARPLRRRLRCDVRRARSARPTSSTPTVIPPSLERRRRRTSCARRWPGCCGPSSSTTTTSTAGSSERGADPFTPTARRGRATSTGTTCTTPTSSRCRTSGSTRGTRRGTSRSTCSR